MLTARLLVVLFAILATIGVLAGFVRYQALDPDTFRGTAEEMIANDNVRDQIAVSLVDELYANVDVTEALEERLPEGQQGLSGVIAAGMQEVSYTAARRLLERPRVQAVWVGSLATTHEQLLRVLDDDLTRVSTEDGVVVLNLRPLVIQLGDRIAIFGRVAERLPEDAGRIEIMEAQQLETAQDATQLLKLVGPVMWLLAFVVGAIAIWLAAGRRRALLRSLAIAFLVVGFLILVVRRVAGSYVVDSLSPSESVTPAAEDAWEILTSLLADGAWTIIGMGVVALVGVWLTGGTELATRARRELAPWLARPEIAYGAAATLLLLVVWWGPTEQTRRWQFLLLGVILLALGTEALRRETAREFPAAVEAPPAPERAAGTP
jgi:NADH:ubiquinone oxidoreductase subunit 6 (subunit J)